MGIVHPGPKNPNWRGGRSVASNGYVLVRVGVGHPLADVRGYAYEHRVVAEEKIGRPLRPGEQVHHIDGNKQNNDPANLEVLTAADHRVEHRSPRTSPLRLPGEPNPEIGCACGCGERLARYDQSGRPRRFIPGHNGHEAARQQSILDALAGGPRDTSDLVRLAGGHRRAIATALSKLHGGGKVVQLSLGRWALSSFVIGDEDVLIGVSRAVAEALLDMGVRAADTTRVARALRELAALYDGSRSEGEAA